MTLVIAPAIRKRFSMLLLISAAILGSDLPSLSARPPEHLQIESEMRVLTWLMQAATSSPPLLPPSMASRAGAVYPELIRYSEHAWKSSKQFCNQTRGMSTSVKQDAHPSNVAPGANVRLGRCWDCWDAPEETGGAFEHLRRLRNGRKTGLRQGDWIGATLHSLQQ